jgi:hypothetical protein
MMDDAKQREWTIRALENECEAISKRLAGAFGDENGRLHDRIKALRRRIGALMLQRDREERPEIYRGGQ